MPAPRSDGPQYEVAGGRVFYRVPGRIEVVRPWGHHMSARRWTPSTGWADYTPSFSIPKLENAAAAWAPPAARAAAFLLESWPAEAVAAARPLPGVYHWPLLVHVNFGGKPFLDLLAGHPPLGLALALRGKLVPWREDLAAPPAGAALASLRRRRIAALLEFPDSERTVRLLARIPLAALSEETFRRLRRALAAGPDVAERLGYLPSVNALAAAILADGQLRPLVAQPCLETLSRWTDPEVSERFLRLLAATARLAASLGRRPAALTEPPQLEVAYRRLLQRATPAVAREAHPDLFTLPPVPETETIRAIRHPKDLLAEGRDMHHCAGGYAARVRSGDAYFYRMAEPERVTICLRPGRRGWELEEARGICNRRIQASTLEAIHRWLGNPPPSPPRLPVFVAPPAVPAPPFGRRLERPRLRRARRPDPRQLSLDLVYSM